MISCCFLTIVLFIITSRLSLDFADSSNNVFIDPDLIPEEFVINVTGSRNNISVETYCGSETEGPDDVYLNLTQYPGEACNRICVAGQRRACYFEFNLENYQAMGVACAECARGVTADCNRPQCVLGDGVEKGVMSINRQVPAPAIQVCKDDLVIVDIINTAGGSAATIHWHGIHMLETPHMDGVPFVTQCPISFANNFRYEFTATESGTHFYHSHSGHHKVNGQYGALIVREPSENVANSDAFDYDLPEHYILISDWMHDYGEQLFPGLPSYGGIYPDSVLINGRGSYFNPKTNESISVPPTRYYVKTGKRYRFRMINAVSHACPFQLQVQDHRLTVIASDGDDIEPRLFDTLVSNSGERYDFVLTANQAKGDFWIRVRGFEICGFRPTETVALLRYTDDGETPENDESQTALEPPLYNEEYPSGVILNHPSATCFSNDTIDHCVSELRAVESDEDLERNQPDYKFFLGFSNYEVRNEEIFEPGFYRHFANLYRNVTVVGAINNLTLISPSYPPLTQPEDIDETQFCDEFHRPEHCLQEHRLCACIHRLVVSLGAIVELIIVDETEVGPIHHPFHLHGYRFMVTGMGQHPLGYPMTVNSAKEMEHNQMLPRIISNKRPPFKDTISIPRRGYAIVRFRANNPGFWIMHCHYEWHLPIGMGLVLQVGSPAQMVSAPRDFPKCGNYQPKVKRLRS